MKAHFTLIGILTAMLACTFPAAAHTPSLSSNYAFECLDSGGLRLLYRTDECLAVEWASEQYDQSYLLSWWIEGQSQVDSILVPNTAGPNEQDGGFRRHCLQGLMADAIYHIHIQANCLAGHTRTPIDTLLSTVACIPVANFPYREDFDEIPVHDDLHLLPLCWRTAGNDTGVWVTGNNGGHGIRPNTNSLFVSSGTHTILLPPINGALHPLHTLQIRLSVHGGSIRVGATDSLGDASQFLLAGIVSNNSSAWQEYTVPLTACAGREYIALMAPAGGVYIDNIIVESIPLCPQPQNITVRDLTASGVHLAWGIPESTTLTEYYVSIFPVDDNQLERTFYASQPDIRIIGLAPDTRYRAHVTAICSGTTLSNADSIDFYTMALPCTSYGLVPDVAAIVDSAHACMLPVLPLLQLVNHEELGSQGQIYAIDLFVELDSLTSGTLTIKMENSDIDHISPSLYTDAATTVFDGSVVFHQGWNHFFFSTPFLYTGENLLITLRGQNGATHRFAGHTTPYYSNTGLRADMRLYRTPCGQGDSCVRPHVAVTEITPIQTTIDWLPGNAETAWDIYVWGISDSAATLADSGVDTNTYTFIGLTEGRNYQAAVVPRCGGTPSPAHADTLSFYIPCALMDSLPYYEDFDDYAAFGDFNNGDGCWRRIGNVQHTVGLDSNGTLRINNRYNNRNFLILPAFADPIEDLSLDFLVRSSLYNSSGIIMLVTGIMTDIADPDSFLPVDSLVFTTNTQANRFLPHAVRFEGLTGVQGHIAFCTSPLAHSGYFQIDNVEVYRTPDCRNPENIRITRTTPTSVTFSWLGYPNATAYEIEYGRRDFAIGTGTIFTGNAADSLTVTGLRPFSHYDFFLRTHCAGGDTSPRSLRGRFNSGCGTIDSLPYIEDIDQWPAYDRTNDAMPPCWSITPAGSRITTYTDDQGHSHSAYNFQGSNPFICMPPIDTTSIAINQLCITFRAWGHSQVIVGVCSNPANIATFQAADTIQLTSQHTLYRVYFDQLTNTGSRIAFLTDGGIAYAIIDSICIDYIPSCPAVDHLTAHNIGITTADIGWTRHGTASEAEIEFGPAGFSLGNGTRFSALSNPVTVTGLQPGMEQDVYVRDICSAGDTSEWSWTSVRVYTFQQPQGIPFCNDFEDSLGIGQWKNVAYHNGCKWSCGTHTDYLDGNHSLYPSYDDGATAATGNAKCVALYRDIDFGNSDTCLSLTFRARTATTNSVNYDRLYIFLADPSQSLPAVWNAPSTPWGDVSGLDILYQVSANISWINHTVDLDTLHGMHRLVFLWMRENSNAVPIALDNICIGPSECPRPFNVERTAATSTSVDLAWYGDTGTLYQVKYTNLAGGMPVTCSTYTNSVHLTGLSSSEQYKVQVRRKCGIRWSEFSPEYTFTVPYCDGESIATVSTSGACVNSRRLPYNATAPAGYTQQIFTAESLGQQGYITHLELQRTGSATNAYRSSCLLYLGHTDKTTFTDSNDFIDPAHLQLVYVGNLQPRDGWFPISLDTPFPYNGTDNLVFAMLDMSGFVGTGSGSYAADITSGLTSIQIDLDQPILLHNRRQIDTLAGHRTLYANRNRIRLGFCPDLDCAIPHVGKPNARPNRTTIRWRDCGDSATYTAEYRRSNTDSWTSLGSTADTFFYIQNTIIGLDYFYRVRHDCPEVPSRWALGTFSSPAGGCLPPEGLRTYNLTHNSATLAWEGDENNGLYYIHVFNDTYDHTDSSYFNRCRFGSLEVGPVYQAVVRAFCIDSGNLSEWSETLRFTLPVCPDVDSVWLVSTTGTSATLEWDGSPEAEGWIVAYGPVGTPEYLCDTIIARTHPCTIYNLTPDEDYEVHVRTLCEGGTPSEHWSERLIFNSSVGIANADARRTFNLQPNPAQSTVQAILPEVSGIACIEILDLMGRTVYQTFTHTSHNTLPLDCPAGVYFVRVSTGDFTAIKRLIKQ